MVYTQMVIDEGEEVVADGRTETEADEAEEVAEEATRTNSERKSRNCSNIIAMCTR